jgi:hypothetical protein
VYFDTVPRDVAQENAKVVRRLEGRVSTPGAQEIVPGCVNMLDIPGTLQESTAISFILLLWEGYAEEFSGEIEDGLSGFVFGIMLDLNLN